MPICLGLPRYETNIWWIGGSAIIPGFPTDTLVSLTFNGYVLAEARTDSNGILRFFGNDTEIPIGSLIYTKIELIVHDGVDSMGVNTSVQIFTYTLQNKKEDRIIPILVHSQKWHLPEEFVWNKLLYNNEMVCFGGLAGLRWL